LDAYFSRVFNPVWTYPDGFSWIEMLRDEKLVGLHAALTPSWNETAWHADYVLPMGYSSERHDLMSQETHASQWIGFRQPVLRVFQEKQGKPVAHTYDTNPGEVWEEDEFWIDLSWAIDPDGSMGIRQWFESPYRHSVPGLPQAAEKESLTPLAYMRKYGAFQVRDEVYKLNEKPVADADLAESQVEPNGVVRKNGKPVGVIVDGQAVAGFNTPSRKLEIFSGTMADWKWPECALPEYYRSHIDRAAQRVSIGGAAEDFNPEYMPSVDWPNDARGDVYTLLPIFRLPTLIHTRSGNAKLLYEIAHKNPLWVNPVDAERLGHICTGELLKVHTEIGYFVLHAWVTEGLTPGVVACSHHLGRWRRNREDRIERFTSALVDLREIGKGQWKMRQIAGVEPYQSPDPDGARVEGRRGRSLRRYLRGHEPGPRGLPEVESPGAPRSGSRQPAPAPVAAARGAARGVGLLFRACLTSSWRALQRAAAGFSRQFRARRTEVRRCRLKLAPHVLLYWDFPFSQEITLHV
jgi:anaerobic selenocysteine-containing dehydrogenase